MKIQLKRSNVLQGGGAKEPSAGQMEYGELAVNYNEADPAIFIKDSLNRIIRIAGADNIADDGTTNVPQSAVPPANPESGNLWFNSEEGRLYIYYVDAGSSQWVDASPDSWDNSIIPDPGIPSEQPGTIDDRYVSKVATTSQNMAGNLTFATDRIELKTDGSITAAGTANFGRVGIGTTSPQRNVHLNSSTTEVALKLTNSTSGSASGDGADIKYEGLNLTINNRESGSITFETSNSAAATIDSSGDILIGTSSPFSTVTNRTQIHLNGTSDNKVNFGVAGTVRQNIYTDATNMSIINLTSTGYLRFNTADTERMRISSNGEVDISTNDLTVYGITVGRGAGSISSNTAVGSNALAANTTGAKNTANGYEALRSNTTGIENTANGYQALYSNTTGSYNTANGRDALYNNTTGIQNTANGRNALRSNTTGDYNTANGLSALYSNTTGNSNTANGYAALFYNTTGYNNTANGQDALYSNDTGHSNTANGRDALYYNTTGFSNTANGRDALRNNTTGYNNTANGRDALQSNTTGDSNTANGVAALYSNDTGDSNTANGGYALYSNDTGHSNTANGRDALYYNTTGFSNTANGRDALRNNTTGYNNTANGRDALYSNTTGDYNTANGRDALYNNTTGIQNTANGGNALQSNTTGDSNTANGLNALRSNTTGDYNTANGVDALRSNTTGDYNTANGLNALYSNDTGANNTANGRDALYSNTTGHSNTANGYEALRNSTTGIQNTANGQGALYSNTIGNSNTANGGYALSSNTTGYNNTANGQGALYSNTTGHSNTANGRDALYNNTTGSGNFGAAFRNNAGTYAPVFNPTTENNRVVMGHTSVTNAYVQVAWTVVSDARDKMNFAPVPHGLDFINQLQPTAYQFKVDRDTEEPNGPVRYGFKAQDILALEGDNPVIIDNEDENRLKYKGEHLVPVLVKAVQELSATVSNLKAENAAFKSRLDAAGI